MMQFAVIEAGRTIEVGDFAKAREWAKVNGRSMRRATRDEIAQQEARDSEPDWASDCDLRTEQILENAGWAEARLQEEMEARAGCIPFDVAMRMAEEGLFV